MQNTTSPNQQEAIYTVSDLNNDVRAILEENFPFVWVEGEISNFAAPHSGHWYFSLKDANAQVRCAMFRARQRNLQFIPKDGMHVLVKASVSLYTNRGEFQLIAEAIEERGEGKLRRAYEALKKKLAAQGLFEAAHKKPLPAYPKQIGIITSATGAAVKDILNVLKRRHACLPVIIYPTLVQGEAAAPNIVAAIQLANARKECDVLIIARGGGSLEDLWAFNEESVALAIFQSDLPIISGVGHEVDFTITDFVADVRAPTPSAAAEMVTRDAAELLLYLTRYQRQLAQLYASKLASLKQQIAWMERHLLQQHPKRKLLEKAQHIDYCELTLTQLQTRQLNKLQSKVQQLSLQLQQHSPLHAIHLRNNQLNTCAEKLNLAAVTQLNTYKTRLGNAAAKLEGLSPLATLQRGYAIAQKNKSIIRDTSQLTVGDDIEVRLASSTFNCRVTGKSD